MESLSRTHRLKRQFADLPTFCFTSTSHHFTEGIKITQNHVAFRLSLETLPVCFAEGNGPSPTAIKVQLYYFSSPC